MGKKHNRRERRAEISAPEQPPASMADETRLTLTSAESKSELERSSSTSEPGNPSSAETDETVSPVEDQANADPALHAAHDAVSEICDAEGTADVHQHGVAGLDGAHQSQTEGVEQTETAVQQPTALVVEAIVEHDNMDAPNFSEISPGKISLGKEVYSVASYAASIGGSWRRAVEAIMEVARLCLDASERLTAPERQELVDKLPFGQSVFSKLITIGKNERLQAPEVQRLLPPHYTIVYSLATLHKYDLDQAIAARVVCPDMTRFDLEKWIRANRATRSPEPPADRANGNPSSKDVQSNESSVLVRDNATEPVQAESAPSPTTPDLHVDGDSQPLVPADSADVTDIGTDTDERFERLKTRWETYVKDDWDDTPDEICDRFVADVLGYPARIARKASEAY
jgi:hypothetical protein